MPLFLLSFSLLVLSYLPGGATAVEDGFITNCPNNTASSFAANSSFENNLNILFSTLSSTANSSTSTGAFSNTSIGTGGQDPVYGIFVCRGDASPAVCGACVANAIASLRTICAHLKSAMNGYENCMFRYSDAYFLGQVDTSMEVFLFNTQNASTNLATFNQVLGDTLNKVTTVASSGGTKSKYATEEAKVSPFQTVYALGQCTPDLLALDCYNCLLLCVAACGYRQGGQIMFPSCNLRYEVYKFYQTVAAVAPVSAPSSSNHRLQPSPADADSNTTSGSVAGNKKLSSSKVAGIAVGAVAIGLVLLALIYCLIPKKKMHVPIEAVVNHIPSGTDDFTTAESLLYDFDTLQAATNNFSEDNKLGEGGFGGVYKGVMSNGQEIAVKRLSRSSHQGVEQFKNEVVLVAKLQHRN